MTAKELKELSLSSGQKIELLLNKLNKHNEIDIKFENEMIVFDFDLFNKFCVQLCKEQREISYINWMMVKNTKTDAIDYDKYGIINAPMPEL